MAILEIKGLAKSFGKTDVLKGVDFSMEKGEVVSIIGSSGSGKTTFLRCINFLEKADAGTVLFDGELIFDATNPLFKSNEAKRKIQSNFGFVFQSFNLFPQYNVLDNVTLAPKLQAKERPDFKANKAQIYKEIEQNALDLLKQAELEDKAHTAGPRGILYVNESHK